MEQSKSKKLFVKFEDAWCDLLGIPNPYTTPHDVWFSPIIPTSDIRAYNNNPNYNYIYDKLWIAKSQNLNCGELKYFKKAKFPIFIKPRWGHKSAGSKNCYKINNFIKLKPFLSKPDMMWSEYISEPEKMTDFILINGRIIFQITAVYSDSVNGISDEWKLISSENSPPYVIKKWTTEHLNGYTGIVNVQYRGDKIIEAGMRLSRGGAYILSAQNTDLIHNINRLYMHNTWDFSKEEYLFDNFYAFKCYLPGPFVYVLPYFIIQSIMNNYSCKPFYEYYFEPVSKNKLCFFQFMHNDFETGMKVKKILENIFKLSQLFFIGFFLITILALLYNKTIGKKLLIIFIVLYSTRLLTPLNTQRSTFKMYKIRLLS